MTVIAWDGKTLAADKRETICGIGKTVTKIFKVGNELVTASGGAPHALELIEWFKRGALPSTFPDHKNNERGWLYVVGEDGLVRSYDGPYPSKYEDKLFACGSGRDYALAAMYLGHTAEEAVAVACHFDINCGNGMIP